MDLGTFTPRHLETKPDLDSFNRLNAH
jgi:hypothetical protein